MIEPGSVHVWGDLEWRLIAAPGHDMAALVFYNPEHRILIDNPADIPPLFVSAILASEDKNFFTHDGIGTMVVDEKLDAHVVVQLDRARGPVGG